MQCLRRPPPARGPYPLPYPDCTRVGAAWRHCCSDPTAAWVGGQLEGPARRRQGISLVRRPHSITRGAVAATGEAGHVSSEPIRAGVRAVRRLRKEPPGGIVQGRTRVDVRVSGAAPVRPGFHSWISTWVLHRARRRHARSLFLWRRSGRGRAPAGIAGLPRRFSAAAAAVAGPAQRGGAVPVRTEVRLNPMPSVEEPAPNVQRRRYACSGGRRASQSPCCMARTAALGGG